jgi:hypothetical protein
VDWAAERLSETAEVRGIIKLPSKVVWQFVLSGWYPGRSRTVPASIPPGHPAAEVLARFGGLTVGLCGAGEQCATSDLRFRPVGPTAPDIRIWNALLATTLIGVAEVHHSHGELYVDLSGRYYGLSCIHDAFYFEGSTFGEAVEGLLFGRRARPMLRPDQESVTLYGVEFTADHPGIHRYGAALTDT